MPYLLMYSLLEKGFFVPLDEGPEVQDAVWNNTVQYYLHINPVSYDASI